MRLIERLAHHARTRADVLAVTEVGPRAGGRSMTWVQWWNSAVAMASRLQKVMATPPVISGENFGGVVMLVSPNRIEYLPAFVGSLMAGMRVLPCSSAMTANELSDLAEKTNAVVVIGDDEARRKLAGCVPHGIALSGLLEAADASFEMSQFDRADEASLLLQSSGTTGAPKIVRRRAVALDADGLNCVAAVGLGDGDRMHTCIPLCHSYAIDHAVLAASMTGCVVEIAAGFDRDTVIAGLCERDVTIMPGVPFMYEMLADSAVSIGGCLSLRHAISAGAPLPARVFDAFYQRLGVRIGQLYGATEMGSATYSDPHAAHFDPASVGRPLGGVRVCICDADRPRVDQPLTAGVEGMVAVAAPSLFDGYVGHEDTPVTDGYFLTRDLGRLDVHGNLTITGRVGLLIEVGGLKVNPVEVEGVLMQHPDVRDAVVVPMPVTQTLNRIKAVVTADTGHRIDRDALLAFTRQRLSPHKVPRVVEVHESLPRTASGKIIRQGLACS